jgi:DNA-binding transcriptional MerR regulator
VLKIGELADRAGVNHRTLRYYERLGLIAPAHKADSGHRYYDETALVRLRRIQQLKTLGLSLDEIALSIDAYFNMPETVDGRRGALTHMRAHLSSVRKQLEALREFEQSLVSNVTRLEIYLDTTA